VRTNGVRNWLNVVKWHGFICHLWLWLYILDPQAVFVKDLDSEDPCVSVFDGEIHLCATRHGNTLILVLICICDRVSKCNVNSRKMSVVSGCCPRAVRSCRSSRQLMVQSLLQTLVLQVDTSGALPALSRRPSAGVVNAIRREPHGHLLQAMNCITKRAPGA
jgi:hypothetical protein